MGALKGHVLGGLPVPVSLLPLNSKGVASKAEILCALVGMAFAVPEVVPTLVGNDLCGAVSTSPSHTFCSRQTRLFLFFQTHLAP